MLLAFLLLCFTSSCNSDDAEIDIKAPFDQGLTSIDNDEYIFFSLSYEQLAFMGLDEDIGQRAMICYADRSTHEIVPTYIFGSMTSVKDDYLYFINPSDGVCRVLLSELVGGSEPNVEVVAEFNLWAMQYYKIFGDRIGYFKCASALSESDLSGNNLVLNRKNRYGAEVKYLCGYENECYYYVASTRLGDDELVGRENRLIEEKDSVQSDLFIFEESNNLISWGYNGGCYIYNGYFYYFSGNALKRRTLNFDSETEIIFKWKGKPFDSKLIGILPSGIYVFGDDRSEVFRIDSDDKSVSKMDFFCDGCYCFVSSFDNELYRVDFDFAGSRAYVVKLTG